VTDQDRLAPMIEDAIQRAVPEWRGAIPSGEIAADLAARGVRVPCDCGRTHVLGAHRWVIWSAAAGLIIGCLIVIVLALGRYA
jgi:hypothetical protein